MSENLWPTGFGEIALRTPPPILREQAVALGQRTANIVVGRAVALGASGPGKFRYALMLYSSLLAYEMPLVTLEHGIELYPVEIHSEGDEGAPMIANNPDQLLSHLKAVFSQEKTKRIIASLIAQSKE